MTDEALFLYHNVKSYVSSPAHINDKSVIANLYRLQKKVDDEIEKQRAESELVFICQPGCCECCSKCFCVSEAEFVQIQDKMLHEWQPADIEQIVQTSRHQWETLVSEAPDIAHRIKGQTTLTDLWSLQQITLPFPCLFLDTNGCCRIYDIRPLACRIHGMGLVSLNHNERPCSKLPPVITSWDKYADLFSLREEVSGFTLLNDGQYLVIRRPAPLFYFMKIIFEGNRPPDEMMHADFYRSLIEIDANEYVKALFSYEQNHGSI